MKCFDWFPSKGNILQNLSDSNQPSTKFIGDQIGTNIDAFKEGENNTALNKVHTAHGGAPHATPWVRATKNVKKPQNQMCESCRKAWFKIFVKQNRNIFGFSHTFDSEVCYCSK